MSEIKIRELEMRIERLEDHKRMTMERINDVDGAVMALNGTLIRIETILKGIPEKIDVLESESNKREGYVNAIKIIAGILLGVLITHAINNMIVANKEERMYHNIEKAK